MVLKNNEYYFLISYCLLIGLANRLGPSRFAVRHYNNMGQSHSHSPFSSLWGRPSQNNQGANTNTVKLRARGLLDHESLACLLVLLFLDEPRLNMSRLHRVLRNLCYHGPTRSWLLEALLSVLQRTGECYVQTDDRGLQSMIEQGGSITPSSGTSPAATSTPTSQKLSVSETKSAQPSWLSASLDAALGCRTNVFQLQRSSSKKHSSVSSVGIHPHAAGLVYRHVLDTLISLAKSFPAQFLPAQFRTSTDLDKDDGKGKEEMKGEDDLGEEGKEQKVECGKHEGDQNKAKDHHGEGKHGVDETDFWNLLVRLDGSSYGRKGKGSQRLHYGNSSASEDDKSATDSALAQLMIMLSHPIVRRSQPLTDRLLRLLGLVTVGLNDAAKSAASSTTTTSQPGRAPLAQDEISPEGKDCMLRNSLKN